MNEELKPCPFCGGKAEVIRHYDNHQEISSSIVCVDCLANFHQEEACCVEENIEAWNRRPEDKE